KEFNLQFGVVIVIPLAANNEIFMVVFAPPRRRDGLAIVEAAGAGPSRRFRPELMPPVWLFIGGDRILMPTGAGPQSPRIIGTTVFSGMLVATVVGIVFIPALFVL
ncbi:efflux RND transporter permease subunit, partial [Enterobacter hormaechei]